VAQKGPLQEGSTVTAQELTETLTPTGKQYTYQVTSDLGTFAPTSTFGSHYIGLTATGYYFDEVQNTISSGTITLNAYNDLSSQSVLNVNLLSTLAYQRTRYLVTNSGLSVDAAIAQADKEVLAVFHIRNEESTGSFSTYDLSGDTDGGHILEAISSMFVYGNTSGQLSALIAKFQSDIAATGTISDAPTLATLAAAAKALNPTSIASNLTTEYASAGVTFSGSNISDWLDQDGDGVIGRYKFTVGNASPSTTYTSTAYLVGPDDGTTCSASAGTLFVNGVATSSPIVTVAVGASLTVSLVSGTSPGDIVSAYIQCGSYNVAKFTVTTKPLSLSVAATITNAGDNYDVALTPDGKSLFIASFDTCADLPSCVTISGNGGLYTFDVTSPAAPTQISLVQYLTNGYTWIAFNGVALSADGTTAYVLDLLQGLRILNVSTPAAPTLTSVLQGTSSTAFALSADGTNVYMAAQELLQVNVTNPASPAVTSTAATTTATFSDQFYDLSVSPDGSQVALASSAFAEIIPVGGGALGTAVNVSADLNVPLAAGYIGNEKALVVSHNLLTVVDFTNPAAPLVVGQIAAVARPFVPNVVAGAAVKYVPATHLAYIKIDDMLSVVDYTDPTNPIVRGSMTLPAPASTVLKLTCERIAVGADGSTIYVTFHGQVDVIQVVR
jgi:hypothetical protein